MKLTDKQKKYLVYGLIGAGIVGVIIAYKKRNQISATLSSKFGISLGKQGIGKAELSEEQKKTAQTASATTSKAT